jgi:hypothetical protein
MTTHELIQRLLDLKSALRRDTEYIQLIEKIAGRYEESIKSLDGALKANDPATIQNNLNNLKSAINQTVLIIKGLRLPKVFTELDRVTEQLKQIDYEFEPPVGGGLGNLIQEFTHFQDDFETLIKGYEATQTLQLISSARALSIPLKVTVNLVDLMIEKLESHIELRENEKTLSVLFPFTDEYRDVLTKLDALNDIYSELCPLFGVSTSQYPLRIVKLETGSLWVSVVGHAAVIGFIVWLLKKAIGYIHRNFTTEGKILFIPKQVEAANSVLEFTKKLQEVGVDTTQAKEQAQKALFAISQNLNNLVSNQSKLEVNDETVSIGDVYDERFLQESKRLLLEEGSKPAEPQTDGDATTGAES